MNGSSSNMDSMMIGYIADDFIDLYDGYDGDNDYHKVNDRNL